MGEEHALMGSDMEDVWAIYSLWRLAQEMFAGLNGRCNRFCAIGRQRKEKGVDA